MEDEILTTKKCSSLENVLLNSIKILEPRRKNLYARFLGKGILVTESPYPTESEMIYSSGLGRMFFGFLFKFRKNSPFQSNVLRSFEEMLAPIITICLPL